MEKLQDETTESASLGSAIICGIRRGCGILIMAAFISSLLNGWFAFRYQIEVPRLADLGILIVMAFLLAPLGYLGGVTFVKKEVTVEFDEEDCATLLKNR